MSQIMTLMYAYHLSSASLTHGCHGDTEELSILQQGVTGHDRNPSTSKLH